MAQRRPLKGRHYRGPEQQWPLYEATGDPVYLQRAKSALDARLSKIPDEYHEPMLTNRRVNREILAAWGEHESGVQ